MVKRYYAAYYLSLGWKVDLRLDFDCDPRVVAVAHLARIRQVHFDQVNRSEAYVKGQVNAYQHFVDCAPRLFHSYH